MRCQRECVPRLPVDREWAGLHVVSLSWALTECVVPAGPPCSTGPCSDRSGAAPPSPENSGCRSLSGPCQPPPPPSTPFDAASSASVPLSVLLGGIAAILVMVLLAMYWRWRHMRMSKPPPSPGRQSSSNHLVGPHDLAAWVRPASCLPVSWVASDRPYSDDKVCESQRKGFRGERSSRGRFATPADRSA